jgi:hypothetical protein
MGRIATVLRAFCVGVNRDKKGTRIPGSLWPRPVGVERREWQLGGLAPLNLNDAEAIQHGGWSTRSPD